MSVMTKKEWMAYIEKTWDAAQKEAWSEPQFECPRCGHCCQALEEKQEPVATVTSESGNPNLSMSWWHEPALPVGTKIYTSPPKAAEWVGLTDDDVSYFRYQATFCDEFDAAFMAELIEKNLKEKNHG